MLKITIKKLNHFKLLSFIVFLLFINQNLSAKFLSKYSAGESLCTYFIIASFIMIAFSFFQFKKLEKDSYYSFNTIIKTAEIMTGRFRSFNLYEFISRFSKMMFIQLSIENHNLSKNFICLQA